MYRLRPNNPLKILINRRDCFKELDVIDQAVCLLNLLSVFGRMTDGCNLTCLGEGPSAAATKSLSAMMSNLQKHYQSVQIVDMSPSGIWEKKSGNLLELL